MSKIVLKESNMTFRSFSSLVYKEIIDSIVFVSIPGSKTCKNMASLQCGSYCVLLDDKVDEISNQMSSLIENWPFSYDDQLFLIIVYLTADFALVGSILTVDFHVSFKMLHHLKQNNRIE